MTDPDIVKRLQADAIFFGTRQEPLLVDDAVCREMAECWEIAADEIERLRKECDEARRSYCWARAEGEEHKAHNIAQASGWDCFKENTDV